MSFWELKQDNYLVSIIKCEHHYGRLYISALSSTCAYIKGWGQRNFTTPPPSMYIVNLLPAKNPSRALSRYMGEGGVVSFTELV